MALQADLVLNTSGYDVALQKSATKATTTLAAAGQKGGAAFGKGIEQGIGKGKESIAQLGSALSVLSPELGGLVTQASALTGALKAGAAGFTALGPAAVGVAGLTAAVGLGAAAWYAYGADARNAAQILGDISTQARATAEQVSKLNSLSNASKLKEQSLQLEAAALLGFDVAESQAKIAAEQKVSAVFAEEETKSRQELYRVELELGKVRDALRGANTGEAIILLDRERALIKERRSARAEVASVTTTEKQYTQALLESTGATDKSTASTVARSAAVRDTAAADREWLDGARKRLAEQEENAKLWEAIEAARRQDPIDAAVQSEALAAKEADAAKGLAADVTAAEAQKKDAITASMDASIARAAELTAQAENPAMRNLNKALIIGGIVKDTVIGVGKDLALGPPGIPLAIATGALGAAAAAMVAATPDAPSFATGRIPMRKGGESLAYLGDDEAVIPSRGVRAAGPDLLRGLMQGKPQGQTTVVSIDGAQQTVITSSRFTTSPRRAQEIRRVTASGDLGTTGRATYR
jgi:hypothetical protein